MMAGRSAHSRRRSQEVSGLMTAHDHRRSSSQGDSTSPHATPNQSQAHLQVPTGGASSGDTTSAPAGDRHGDHHAKGPRAFLSDLLSGSNTSQKGPHLPVLVPPYILPAARAHLRADSLPSARDTPSPTPSMATSTQLPKPHASPSKASSSRTYDSKLVQREMHRLGNLAHTHLPIGLPPTLSNAPSSASSLSTMVAPSQSSLLSSAAQAENPWAALHVHVLPLFNGEPLRVPIEDLNVLVRRHIQLVVSAPSKAIQGLEHDTSELLASGMVTLGARLAGVEDDRLVARVVELWAFFWDHVLPYVEGALLPLQTDPLLSSLSRPKAHKQASSPVHVAAPPTKSVYEYMHPSASSNLSQTQIDVRTLALLRFRDGIVLPAFPRLYAQLTVPKEEGSGSAHPTQNPRLQQMLLVLVSIRPSSPTFLSPADPDAGDIAIQRLLGAVRTPTPASASGSSHAHTQSLGAPSFLSGGVPRDRRGRIAGREKDWEAHWRREDEEEWGGETPRIGGTEREREKEFLESLRSPELEPDPRASMGGWGLGVGTGSEDTPTGGRLDEEDEEDELDWDQAQEVVERMVGMNSKEGVREVPVMSRRRREAD